MSFVLGLIIIVLVFLEYTTRKQENRLNELFEPITKDSLEERLDAIENLKYTYGKIYACNLENQSLILVSKKEYSKSEQLIVMHEVGHFFHLSENQYKFNFKIFVFSKAVFYLLGILSMFIIVLSAFFNPFIYIFKYLLIVLITAQIIHLLLLTYYEILANTYIKSYFKEEKHSLVYVYTSMASQILYWLLFITLTIVLYEFIFNY